MIVGGVLITIAITACNASPASQPPAVNTSPIASPSIAPDSPLPIVSPTQTAASVSSPQQEAVQVIRDYYSFIRRS